MNASFEEKTIWMELLATVLVLGGYFVEAARLLSQGVTEISEFVPLFTGTIVLLVIVLVSGTVAVAITSGPAGRDERDRLVAWRANANSSWILAAGVFAAIVGLAASVEAVWIAHLLLLSLLLSESAGFVLQLVYYRRGMQR